MAEDDEVAGFVASLPDPQPNLFFAAVQLLTGPRDMPATGPELSALVKRRGREVAGVMRTHRTQTNEVGRCAVLLPALPPGPLALVEVGASAGLCLLLDRYFYDWGSTRAGPAASSVRLRCRVAGPAPLPSAVPEIAWRRGLDLHPVDVNDPAAARWLVSCVWADQPERRQRLEAAIELARAERPVVRAGDLVEALPALLADAPDDARLVVFHSAVLSYVSADRREAFAGALAAASERRDVVWVSNEAPGIVPGLAPPPPHQPGLRFLLGRTTFSRGRRQDERLAVAHPHGAELSWL